MTSEHNAYVKKATQATPKCSQLYLGYEIMGIFFSMFVNVAILLYNKISFKKKDLREIYVDSNCNSTMNQLLDPGQVPFTVDLAFSGAQRCCVYPHMVAAI